MNRAVGSSWPSVASNSPVMRPNSWKSPQRRPGQSREPGPDTTAEVAQIVLARNRRLQPRKVPIALAFVVLAEVVTEAGIIGVAVDPARHFQEEGTGGVIAMAAFFG